MAEKLDAGPRLGADPELFVTEVRSEKKKTPVVIPVCGLVGGTKQEPVKVPLSLLGHIPYDKGSVGDFAYQEDNVMFEFNVPAVSDPEYFPRYIQGFLNYLRQNTLANKSLGLSFKNRYTFQPKFLEHPLAKVIGCSPDYCAYLPRDSMIRRPFGIEELGNERFCGGHLHVQYNHAEVPRPVFARFMDLVAGLPFLNLDKQGDRRKFYGVAGVFRPKPYGIEYRTPSNFWLKNNEQTGHLQTYLAKNIFSLAHMANREANTLKDIYQKVPWQEVQKAINTENVVLAKEIVEHVVKFWPGNMYSLLDLGRDPRLLYKKAANPFMAPPPEAYMPAEDEPMEGDNLP